MTLIVGMARSGIAAAKLLRGHGVDVFVSDSGKPSTAELDAIGIPHETGRHTVSRFVEAQEIVVSPGVPLDIPALVEARSKGVPVVSELEVAYRYLRGETVAITGSNGKTTTTALVGEIFKKTGRPVQVGGNVGTAMTTLVDTSTPDTINIIETSSFQLDTIQRFRPRVGLLLNITPDHLDRYADFDAYRLSKFRMFLNQKPEDCAVLNADDPSVYPPPVTIRSRMILFSQNRRLEAGSFRLDDALHVDGRTVMPVRDIPLRGRHNVENVLAAIAVTAQVGIDPARMAEAIRAFKAVEHRLEYVAAVNGIEFYNDSKATNVDSAIKAVESFDGNIILILGGKDKGASYAPLVQAMAGRVKHVLLIGAAAPRISEAIADRFPKTPVRALADAVQKTLAIGAPGDIALLAPACASFDMFDNFEHRGRVFKAAVASLKNGRTKNETVAK